MGAVRIPMNSACCLAFAMAVNELDNTAEVNQVRGLARRAWQAFALDAYAMSAALMIAQVHALARTDTLVPWPA